MHDDVLMTTTFYLSLENAMTIEMIIIHKVVGAILFIIETGTHTICAHTRTLTHTHVQTFQQTIIPTANIQLGMLAVAKMVSYIGTKASYHFVPQVKLQLPPEGLFRHMAMGRLSLAILHAKHILMKQHT